MRWDVRVAQAAGVGHVEVCTRVVCRERLRCSDHHTDFEQRTLFGTNDREYHLSTKYLLLVCNLLTGNC